MSSFNPQIAWPANEEDDDAQDNISGSYSVSSSSFSRQPPLKKRLHCISDTMTTYVRTLIDRILKMKFSMENHVTGNEKVKTTVELGDISANDWKSITTMPLFAHEIDIQTCSVDCFRDSNKFISWDIKISLDNDITYDQDAITFFLLMNPSQNDASRQATTVPILQVNLALTIALLNYVIRNELSIELTGQHGRHIEFLSASKLSRSIVASSQKNDRCVPLSQTPLDGSILIRAKVGGQQKTITRGFQIMSILVTSPPSKRPDFFTTLKGALNAQLITNIKNRYNIDSFPLPRHLIMPILYMSGMTEEITDVSILLATTGLAPPAKSYVSNHDKKMAIHSTISDAMTLQDIAEICVRAKEEQFTLIKKGKTPKASGDDCFNDEFNDCFLEFVTKLRTYKSTD